MAPTHVRKKFHHYVVVFVAVAVSPADPGMASSLQSTTICLPLPGGPSRVRLRDTLVNTVSAVLATTRRRRYGAS